MTPLPANFRWTSGKAAMLGSFNKYMQTQIPDENFDFDSPVLPANMPGYGIMEKGLYNLGAVAFEHLIGYKDGDPVYARKNQTLVEISAWDNETLHSNAVDRVRVMRDKVVYVLYNAGRTNDSGAFILPPMKIYDYTKVVPEEIGVMVMDPADNAINEQFVIDPINQNIKTYRILVRLFWYEYI